MTDREMPPPGPERDALVAELVFGWELCKLEYCRPETIDGTRLVHRHYFPASQRYFPKTSTNQHAAFDVLLEMQRQGWRWQVDMGERGICSATFMRGHECDTLGKTDFGMTFAGAVTAAAIRAKWAEQEAKS